MASWNRAVATPGVERWLSPAFLAVGALLFFLAGLLCATLLPPEWR